jgi:glycosyltransferase involved in cell wall biosynthesis
MEVTIDGIPYVPKNSAKHKFGVAITTHNRKQECLETVEAVLETIPSSAPVFVVDDGSDEPFTTHHPITVVRNEVAQGIPAAKNRCIELLMDAGVDHLFLLDDDTRPIKGNQWWKPYIESEEPHLQYCWTHFSDGGSVPKMDVLYLDSKITAYGWSMGCMLYAERQVIERVGGMRLDFGKGMEEHAEWSRRIWNAGFTTFVHQDCDSAGLFYASDEHQSVKRSFTSKDRDLMLQRNIGLREKYWNTTDYIEYRTPYNVVLTSYFNGVDDPQRGQKWRADLKAIEPLEASLGDARFVIITDCLAHDHAQWVDATNEPAYKQRWISYSMWLRDHPEVGYAWLVDATDVRMLNNPFTSMRPGTLYCGWEPKPVGIPWIRQHGSAIAQWIEDNKHSMLLNPGVVGGDRATLQKLCKMMIDMWQMYPQADSMHEMAFFNYVVYEHFPWHLTGPQVATLFKFNVKADEHAWWAHK